MPFVDYIFMRMVVLMQFYFQKSIAFSICQLGVNMLTEAVDPQSYLLHDLSRDALLRRFSLRDLALTEAVLARPPVLHQQVLLLIVPGDDGPIDRDKAAIIVHCRDGTRLNPDEVRKVLIHSFHEEQLLLYARVGLRLLVEVKLVEEAEIGGLEVVGQSVFGLLLVVEVEDELDQQLLYDLFRKQTPNLRDS